jgi:hypothetical protein
LDGRDDPATFAGASKASSSFCIARVSVRAVGRARSAAPQMSPHCSIRAGIVRVVNALMRNRPVNSVARIGADTVAAARARALYALAALLPRAFCIAST